MTLKGIFIVNYSLYDFQVMELILKYLSNALIILAQLPKNK